VNETKSLSKGEECQGGSTDQQQAGSGRRFGSRHQQQAGPDRRFEQEQLGQSSEESPLAFAKKTLLNSKGKSRTDAVNARRSGGSSMMRTVQDGTRTKDRLEKVRRSVAQAGKSENQQNTKKLADMKRTGGRSAMKKSDGYELTESRKGKWKTQQKSMSQRGNHAWKCHAIVLEGSLSQTTGRKEQCRSPDDDILKWGGGQEE